MESRGPQSRRLRSIPCAWRRGRPSPGEAIGTVALIGSPNQRIYCVAYSRMDNGLTAQSSMNDLWISLDHLWETIADRGRLGRVAIPIMGAELARIYALDRENLLKVIVLSFMARSRMVDTAGVRELLVPGTCSELFPT